MRPTRLNLELNADTTPVSLSRLLTDYVRPLLGGNLRAAVVMDYASRLPVSVQQLSDAEHEFFTACEKLAHNTHPIATADAAAPLFNPMLWLCNRENDLPSWFTLDNEPIHRLTLPLPDFETRQRAAQPLAEYFCGHASASAAELAAFANTFAQLTEGMSLHSLFAIAQLADAQRLTLAEIADAVRCFKIGVLDNPWKNRTCATAFAPRWT
ncbi:MAG: hypothetical protein HC889_20050 [Synechococcaceae cyanobacterium SM1_2_3]|nr:hypothetical protein [Synechococcaceae cyanobacterium SM1_2_3]